MAAAGSVRLAKLQLREVALYPPGATSPCAACLVQPYLHPGERRCGVSINCLLTNRARLLLLQPPP